MKNEKSIIQEVINFNKSIGQLTKGYNERLETSYQIEEALEGVHIQALAGALGFKNSGPKETSRAILSMCEFSEEPDKVSCIDKACDAIVFALGSMAKLGLNADLIKEALTAVVEANKQKISMPSDSYGKTTKPTDFVGPEKVLKEIVEKANKAVKQENDK